MPAVNEMQLIFFIFKERHSTKEEKRGANVQGKEKKNIKKLGRREIETNLPSKFPCKISF